MCAFRLVNIACTALLHQSEWVSLAAGSFLNHPSGLVGRTWKPGEWYCYHRLHRCSLLVFSPVRRWQRESLLVGSEDIVREFWEHIRLRERKRHLSIAAFKRTFHIGQMVVSSAAWIR